MRQTDKEYAEALFTLASEENICDICLSDIKIVREVFLESPQYIDFLASPAVPMSERLAALDEAFAGRVHDYVLYFLKLLCEKGRANIFFQAADEFEKMYLAFFKKTTARICCAVELSEEQKSALLRKLEKLHGKKIEPLYFVDASLLGGISVEIDGTFYDGTLKSRIRDVKEVMMDEQAR